MITAADVIRAVENYLKFNATADGEGEGHFFAPVAKDRIDDEGRVLP